MNTDKNENYYKSFYVKDSELGKEASGYFSLKFDDSKIYNNKYIRTNNLIGNTTSVVGPTFQISKRDTIIENNVYIPKKTFTKVNLKNFVSQKPEDYFEVQTFYPFGANSYTTYTIFVAAGEKNIISIFRRKNGVNTVKDSLLFIPQNNNIELTYNY